MCLMIEQPKGRTFSRADIADYLTHNPDGFGAAWGDGKRLHIIKSLDNKDVARLYAATVGGKHAVLHFRQATHGATDLANCHPYQITERIAVAHNGVLSCGNEIVPAMSDTWHLVEYVLKPIAVADPERLFTQAMADLLGGIIGRANKLAFVHADGRVQLVNASAGTHYRGVWYSNTYAWSAPYSSSRYYYARRDEDDWGWTAPKASATASASAPACAPQHEASPLWDDSEIWHAVAEAHAKGGVSGVAEWVRENRLDAEYLIVEYSTNVDAIEAQDWLDSEPAAVADFLSSFLDEDVPSIMRTA